MSRRKITLISDDIRGSWLNEAIDILNNYTQTQLKQFVKFYRQTPHNYFQYLPNAVKLLILSKLTFTGVINMLSVSKKWHYLLRPRFQKYWQRFCAENLPYKMENLTIVKQDYNVCWSSIYTMGLYLKKHYKPSHYPLLAHVHKYMTHFEKKHSKQPKKKLVKSKFYKLDKTLSDLFHVHENMIMTRRQTTIRLRKYVDQHKLVHDKFVILDDVLEKLYRKSSRGMNKVALAKNDDEKYIVKIGGISKIINHLLIPIRF